MKNSTNNLKREIIKTYSHLKYWRRKDNIFVCLNPIKQFLSFLKCDKQPFINSSFPTAKLEGDFFFNSNLNLMGDKNGYF